MKVLRKLFRAMPKPTTDGAFSPSPLGIKLGASSKTNFDGGAHAKRFDGKQNRILMICTEEHQMIMANGNKFSTGNHPVEMALPMLHLINAGFEIDVVTPTGAPVAIEMWAMPEDDTDIKKLFSDFESVFHNPGSLVDFVANRMLLDPMHAAIFIPGGHGSMLGLPHNPDLGKVLHWAHNTGLHTLALCHGPAALLAAKDNDPFLYGGYKIAAFPDTVDRKTPLIGYLPGPMPWYVCETLEEQGMEIVNIKADKSVYIDRHLLTGASPLASNDFGRLAATTLLKRVDSAT